MTEFELIDAICHGVNPVTGEVLDTPRDPALDRARLHYLDELMRVQGRRMSGARPPMHGKAWGAEDDSRLRALWGEGRDADTIAAELGRGMGAIIARLVHIGACQDRDLARQEHDRRLAAKA
ncbi:hypothetical protein ACFOKJ_01475 [Vogesella amnigena]|uniref:Uncharacterized protein n=1 Tax=Vogesella amnigena TaxID=1507449 RepID=A0ABV7TQT3_9NEIS